MQMKVDSKIPVLKELGGYMPGLDHLVPVDCSFQRFQEYAEYLKQYLPY